MRCSMCGHDNPPGGTFCLNCGTAMGGYVQTPPPAAGLPVTCTACGVANPVGMKFCRNCGTALAQAAAPPLFGSNYPPAPPPGLPPGLPPMTPPPGIPPSMAPGGWGPEPVGMLATLAAPGPGLPPGAPAGAVGSTGGAVGTQPGGMIKCPRCSASTPGHLAYCQQCGLHLQAVAPTDPGGAVRAGGLSGGGGAAVAGSIDPQGATLATPSAALPSLQGPAARPPAPAAQGTGAPAAAAGQWGTLVLVNRDGSDGERFALSGELAEIGRGNGGAGGTRSVDISFAQDRFLARTHARIERKADGVRVVCQDSLNGVFRRLDLPTELEDGAILLVGREVLRYERVDADEAAADPLVRHGVALFGSPPRAPWGRLSELLPSGGVRDIRHLNGPEFVIGREEGDFVVRDDAFMSRRHAAINWDGQRARVTDLGSSNGTFVRLAGSALLKHGDHLRMGDQLFRIELS